MRRDVLRAPVREPLGIRHIAKATALAWLQGDVERTERYLDDLEGLEHDAASWRTLPPTRLDSLRLLQPRVDTGD